MMATTFIFRMNAASGSSILQFCSSEKKCGVYIFIVEVAKSIFANQLQVLKMLQVEPRVVRLPQQRTVTTVRHLCDLWCVVFESPNPFLGAAMYFRERHRQVRGSDMDQNT